MLTRQKDLLGRFVGVQEFLDCHDGVLGTINQSGARQALDDVVLQLDRQAVDQDAGFVTGKAELSRERAHREALRTNHMRPIAAIARARLHEVGNLEAFALPDTRTASTALVAAAAAMADAASGHIQVFIDLGLPKDFVTSLLAAAARLQASVDVRAHSRKLHVDATAGLAREQRRGRLAVRVLDALIVPQLGRHRLLLAQWRRVKRVDGAPHAPNVREAKDTDAR